MIYSDGAVWSRILRDETLKAGIRPYRYANVELVLLQQQGQYPEANHARGAGKLFIISPRTTKKKAGTLIPVGLHLGSSKRLL